jgi:hypothetical protein
VSRSGTLTPAAILQVAHEIREGAADPKDARRLIELFCECTNDNLPEVLLDHLRYAFSSYLTDERSIESALGLVRKVGHPAADEKTRQDMALEILRLRLAGDSYQESQAKVSEQYGWGLTIVGKAWRDNKRAALDLLRLERWEDGRLWKPDEIKRLKKILAKEDWLTEIELFASGYSSNKAT